MEMSYHLTHSYEPNICAVVCNEYMHNHRLPYFFILKYNLKGQNQGAMDFTLFNY